MTNIRQEIMKKSLGDLLDKTGSILRDINAKRYALHFKRQANKKQMLMTIFQKMKHLGVDPGDSAQVKKFLDTLKETNPDGHEMFSKGLTHLLKEEKPPKIDPSESDF